MFRYQHLINTQQDDRICAFIEANRELEALDIVKSIGKDKEGIHYYLFFGYRYI